MAGRTGGDNDHGIDCITRYKSVDGGMKLLAVDGLANWLVTGDQDVLALSALSHRRPHLSAQ
jgi:hypothetical protein